MFGAGWQFVARAVELAESGDHVVAEIAGVPVLLVRDGDVLRAFHNVCRHRAGPLALCAGKGLTRLRCHYHGWTYGLDGRLRAAPEMAEAEGFAVGDIALPPVRVTQWQGLVWATLDDAAPPLETVLDGVAERIAPIDCGAMRLAATQTYVVACDWKVYVDNFLEGYHVPHVHPALGDVVEYRNYTVELGDWWSLQHSPLRNSTDFYGDGEAFYWFVWPNTMLNILEGRLQTNRVLPAGHGRCTVEFGFLYTPAAAHRAAADLAFTDVIQAEDAAICEAVQRGIVSGSYTPGRLSPKREAAVWHFQERLRAAYAVSPSRLAGEGDHGTAMVEGRAAPAFG